MKQLVQTPPVYMGCAASFDATDVDGARAGRGVNVHVRGTARNPCCPIGMPIRNRVGPVDDRDTDDSTVPSGVTHRTDAEERMDTRTSRSDQWIWLDPVWYR